MPLPNTNMVEGVKNSFSSLWDFLTDPATADGIEQASRNTGLPGVAAAGMVLNPKTLGKFNELMSKALKEVGPDVPGVAAEALAFMKAKYPKLSGLAKAINVDMNLPFRGLHDNMTKEITINPRMSTGFQPDIAATIGHELTHAMDLKRKGEGFLRQGRELFDNVDMATLPHAMVEKYRNIPSEKRANQAGKTAFMGYNKYMDLYFDALDRGDAGP